ncbi:sister chromatid cohesion protein PDS5 homolog C-like isoform X2 [Rhodamnia argentea]|uniref:Sister chromatid cohesion protein PDS5 homolog C-like isoform X2 n=1 Tax=Rhodamnia argentea TaxID=178133 RepID=A0ABM3HAB3_9MYRT|nr:sister chromatid cohesion protein PDS5 homolog C-like isoform X2 [Rhodamnia argentea]
MSDKELQEQLVKAGTELLEPPSSVDELMPLLEELENCLSRVEQSPTPSMLDALSPSLKALVADQLFRHSDADVRVATASCISEITRITAPEAPYEDDLMKEVFQLIVSSFEKLYDKSSRSYTRRASILETVAKVRSCVVMLDLECDALVVEMFQHLLNSIRDYHPEHVFQSMETIMTLIIDESEDVSPDLLSPVLDSVKSDNKEVLPIARKLGEMVLKNCASKLQPYFYQALKALGTSIDEYSNVITSMYQEASAAVEENNNHAASKHKVNKEKASHQVGLVSGRSPKSVISNGATQKAGLDSISNRRPEDAHRSSPPKVTKASSNENIVKLNSANVAKKESKLGKKKKGRGRKPGSSTKSNVTPDGSQTIPDLPHDNSPAEYSPSESEKETAANPSSPKPAGDESMSVAFPYQNEGQPDESRPRKGGRRKKQELAKEVTGPAADISKNERTSDKEVKPHSNTVSVSTNMEDGSSTKRSGDKKGVAKRKVASEKDLRKSAEAAASPKSAMKAGGADEKSHETPKDGSKRKRTLGKEVSDAKEYGEDLVGSKIKVWWPQDRAFYEGVVDSFDPVRKRHKVLYTDGDQEILNLKKQKWEFVEGNSVSYQGQEGDGRSPDTSPELTRPLKKRAKMKGGKMETSAKKVDASSSKSNTGSTKFGRKSKGGSNSDGKFEKDGIGKSKDRTSENGSKSGSVALSKTTKTGKLKDEDPSMPHVATNSGEESSETTKSKKGSKFASKGSELDSSGKPEKLKSNGSDKIKSGLLKVEDRIMDNDSVDSAETETNEEKSVPSVPGIGSKSGKKRQRGA